MSVVASRVTARTAIVLVGLILLGGGLLNLATSDRVQIATRTWPVDFDINWVAARRLVDGQAMYDRTTSRREGERLVGPAMSQTGRDAFSSYIGSPPVALSHVPFLAFDHDTAAQLYRTLSLLAMVVSVLLTAWTLAPTARAPVALVGCGVLVWTFPMFRSLALGQGTGLVMLSLAVGIWGSPRDRSTVAGIGFGLAAVLKVSPVILLVYLVIRGRRRVVIPAVATAVACFALSALVGRAGDLVTWIRDVSPEVSKGTISGYNQSVVGAFARLTTHVDDLSARIGPGSWYVVAYLIWAVALFGLWHARRGRVLDPLELGVLVLVLLLAGPLSWDHYFVWAVLPVVLLADPTRWRGRAPLEAAALVSGLGAALVLCRRGLVLPSPAAVHADAVLRVTTSRYTIAAVLVTVVAFWLLLRSPTADPERAEWADERGTPVGAARPVVAAGVHQRR